MLAPVVMYGCESWIIRKLSTKELMLLKCNRGIGVPVLPGGRGRTGGLQTEPAATSRSVSAIDKPANRLSTQLGTLPNTAPGAVEPASRASGPLCPPEGMVPGWEEVGPQSPLPQPGRMPWALPE